jgi:site-specific DNA recombinase
VLVDDTSRISRNLSDAVRIVENLKFRGLRVVAVSQGIDSQNDQSGVLTIVHGLVDSLYIKELAKKTHRGLEGKALRGLSTDGRCFGYQNVTGADGVKQVIDEGEASIVKRVFQMCADGASLRTIAKTLNAESVP